MEKQKNHSTFVKKKHIMFSNKITVYVLLAIFAMSCNTVSSEEKAIREAAKAKLTTPAKKRINKYNDNDVEVTGPTTTISYKETSFNFGDIKEGVKAKHTFEFTNTGTVPLVIKKAKGSCGCTVPTYSSEPVAPGETGKIDVVFDSSGRPGKISKYVTITANTEPTHTKITLGGKVIPKKKKKKK